ncbi:zinc finger and SCAN domain-containing protein 12-like isoform X2 [Neolamprologus brichardi]|uniref:zinc finger and SCAN domain-containing protein 12-like isoform X2 n=1 Tax=Neolamprologus brichardi TaxID=32507 RepID=UPI001643995A|nr:zinc finger and SCAN domain-containing protein 12-like isoform X2 [Neolamprologus brichardi]
MPSVQYLREFINERLTAAAEQIFLEFEKTIVQYEEEIDRQRRLLDITWKPEIKLHRTVPRDVPQQPVCKEEEEEEVLPEQQLWNQERSSSVEQEEPEAPQIKEEQEELCSSQEGEQLGLKEETDTFMVTAAEESGYSELEPMWEQLLSHSSAGAESQHQEGSGSADSGSTDRPPVSYSQCNSNTGEKSIKCDVCGKSFKYNSRMKRHYSMHTGEKPYSCDICGKGFSQRDNLAVHMRIHTGEKPYPCIACGKNFTIRSNLLIHMRIHTGEKPSSCKICGKMFRCHSHLWRHKKIHTRQKS